MSTSTSQWLLSFDIWWIVSFPRLRSDLHVQFVWCLVLVSQCNETTRICSRGHNDLSDLQTASDIWVYHYWANSIKSNLDTKKVLFGLEIPMILLMIILSSNNSLIVVQRQTSVVMMCTHLILYHLYGPQMDKQTIDLSVFSVLALHRCNVLVNIYCWLNLLGYTILSKSCTFNFITRLLKNRP